MRFKGRLPKHGASYGAFVGGGDYKRMSLRGIQRICKNVLDRSVSYVSALFEIRKGIMRHKPRYAGNLNMRVLFYGAGGREEKDAARELARANAENLSAALKEVSFYKTKEAFWRRWYELRR